MRLLRSPHALVIAAGSVLGAAAYSGLPAPIAPVALADEGPYGLGRELVAFLLPTASALTYVLLRALCTRHPIDRDSAAAALRVYDAIMLRVLCFLMAVHATMIAALVGLLSTRAWAASIVSVLVGLVLIGVGNLLPRTRPNLAIGIKTRHTLADRAVWSRTHRLAGYAAVGLGIVIVVAVLVLPAPFGPRMGRLVEPAAAVGIPALVLYARRIARA